MIWKKEKSLDIEKQLFDRELELYRREKYQKLNEDIENQKLKRLKEVAHLEIECHKQIADYEHEYHSTKEERGIELAKLQAKIESDLKVKALEIKNSILNKFTTNLQSRIYSQLAQQLTDNLFSGESDSGSFNLDGNKIDYVKTLDEISLTITDASGGTTEIVIPVASFKF